MKKTHTIKRSADDKTQGKTDWQHVDSLSEEELEEAACSDPDAQSTTAEFWADAALTMPESKQLLSLRLDRDIVAWYKKQGRGYQTRMNAVLRAYMEAHSHEER